VLASWTERKSQVYGYQFKKEMKGDVTGADIVKQCREELEEQAQLLRRALVRFHERERGRHAELQRINMLLLEPAASAAKFVSVRIRAERVLHEMMALYRALYDTDIPGVAYDFTL
jgi:hypothetical protein